MGRKIRDLKASLFGRKRPVKYQQQGQQLFGFRTRVKLVDRQPCLLGVTCDLQGNRINKRQTGEEFGSEAPPDCRTEFDRNICNIF